MTGVCATNPPAVTSAHVLNHAIRLLPVILLLPWIAQGFQHGEAIRGAALISNPKPLILTWGDQLLAWDLSGRKPKVLLKTAGFGPGGCVADINNDGLDDLLVQKRPGLSPLIALIAPSWTERVVEPETDFHDCLPFTIDGRRGVLVPHLHAQLRFYLFPNFEYKELYSIYTPSEQGGILAHDVDSDGLTDLFFGNYWVKNPGRLDVAWRLYAINTIHYAPTAATASLGLLPDGTLIWAESTAPNAHIAAFSPPPDRKQLWIERRLPPLDYPRAILVQPDGVYIGHANGIVKEDNQWRRTVIATGFPVLNLFNVNGTMWAVTPSAVRRVRSGN